MRGAADVAALLDSADEVFVPVIVVGELLAGFKQGNREQQNRALLNEFLAVPRVSVLWLDEETAERYAIISSFLRSMGRPVPTNDLWISSVAMQHGLAVITGDRHFQSIPQVVTVLCPPLP